MHRMGLRHPLGLLPLVGGRFRFTDAPVGGSSTTVMKTAHADTAERHFTRFGSQARQISALSDPDANYFALLGGQDGWFNIDRVLSLKFRVGGLRIVAAAGLGVGASLFAMNKFPNMPWHTVDGIFLAILGLAAFLHVRSGGSRYWHVAAGFSFSRGGRTTSAEFSQLAT